ncbi:hypothetical protein JOD82_002036 [Paenibacillus sp. 1182]|uniref:hypothetical protein n=1 Tax=Paenibacillus sp. 1182 TaxID=2806565 RepID=UPI001AE597A6|nr:hypothetical protein [Paenibacillus sp. 1182]MBP1309016.1 hypothetical protein [Paenibacillus sp. 1182]
MAMWFWFFIFVSVFLLLSPSIWCVTKENKSVITFWQLGKIAYFFVLALLFGYFVLKDHTYSVLFSTILIPYGIWLCVETSYLFSSSKWGLFIPIALVWIYMTIIFPLTIRQDLYNLVQAVATGESKQVVTNVSQLKKITGKVLRVGTVQMGDAPIVQVILENSNKVFNLNPKEAIFASFIKEGDMLNLSFVDTKEANVTVEKMTNQTIHR